MDQGKRIAVQTTGFAVVLTALITAFSGVVAAHGGAVAGAQRKPLQIPFWLFVSTGGGVVGASFLLASFVTDRAFIDRIHDARQLVTIPIRLPAVKRRLTGAIGILFLTVTVAAAFLGPQESINFAILFVWVVWWTGFTMLTYTVGNAWPALNPWRAILGETHGKFDYPDEFGAWPSVAGLLAFVWLEVVSPVSENPRVLGLFAIGYTTFTLLGGYLFGADAWFENADPISNVFRYFGAVAPVATRSDGVEFTWPGARLSEVGLIDGADDAGFVLALLWVTTFDGLVSTPTWTSVTRAAVERGAPPLLFYLATLVVGYTLFLWAYFWASRLIAKYAETYRSPTYLRDRFAASLLPIAVGYHLAHYLGYFLSLIPTSLAVSVNPFGSVSNPQVLVIPPWFGGLSIAFVILGHLVAIWVAHATAFDIFPDRLQAIRSQYPMVGVMVFYTMLSLWIVTQPSTALPYL
ncbi:hypothetical protein ACFQMA_11790 [Halosimplex aquaticum]|uniref:Uncharacterized protein n=1 Tax=Halosimplex aquaticum TaxID=3026162 RepID=A0ABD5Y4U5_9EURY|nr:hypothetical protein [Halosimplex aquaticum]